MAPCSFLDAYYPNVHLMNHINCTCPVFHGSILSCHLTGHLLPTAFADLPGWPLLSPVKVQLQKCDKCSRKFFSSIKYRRHIRLKKLDKDTGKSRELLGSFWNKLSAEEKKEIVSFKDLTFEMGRGRTTTGTVIACLLKLQIEHGRPIRVLVDDIVQGEEMDEGSSDGKENGINNAPKSCLVKENKIEEQTRAFGINGLLLLWKITNIFENGVQCREVLDTIIDRCSALQNIRQAVLQYRKVFNQQHVEPRVRQLALNCGAEYLDRYFRLIAFAAYLGSEAFDGLCGQGLTKMSFKSWLHQRPELQAMKWSVRLWPGRFFTVSEELRVPEESQHGNAVMEAIVTTRNGSVFGKGSILKMYSSWVRELAVT
ncbi:hypothetical protein SAY87_008218 [Trapa incisa]|uniref:C2H2-type domain-containing protein n=1 Tax=Trapa incisa TaxID=236973 RepID=A0AAN7QFT3_9MYRT|nr:hypothetical protein SAY87_008218 [Trapa incisa]